MKKNIKSSLFILLTFSLTSCGTIFTGSTDRITFNTTPEKAKVYEGGVEKCTTPCSIDIRRSMSPKVIQLKKEGYEPRNITLDKKFNAVSILNIVGFVGWVVDAFTPSLTKYDTKLYNIELEPKK